MEPRLVNPGNFIKVPEKIPNVKLEKIKLSKYLNIFLFLVFIVFMAFFLYNCKYGKPLENEPLPYSIVYNINSV
jgi:hypothetical protein